MYNVHTGLGFEFSRSSLETADSLFRKKGTGKVVENFDSVSFLHLIHAYCLYHAWSLYLLKRMSSLETQEC